MTHHGSWVRLAIYFGFLVLAAVRLVVYIRRWR